MLPHLGGNRRFRPVPIAVNADWRKSGAVLDRQQPAHRAVSLKVLALRARVAAERVCDARGEAGRSDRLHRRCRQGAVSIRVIGHRVAVAAELFLPGMAPLAPEEIRAGSGP